MIAGYPDGAAVPVVVGGGPVPSRRGAATAMLARRGVGTLVVDHYAQVVYPLPRAVHSDGEIFRILQGSPASTPWPH